MERDRLKKMMELQRDFQKKFYDIENLSDKERVELTKTFMLHLHREVAEALNMLPFKFHKNYDWSKFSLDREEYLEELIDVFKFYLTIVVIWGYDDKQFFDMFLHKTEKVAKRFEEDWKEKI